MKCYEVSVFKIFWNGTDLLLLTTGRMIVEYWKTNVFIEMATNVAFFRVMTTCVWVDSYQLMEEKRQEVTMKVDAPHSSGKLVGPTYYVTSQKRATFILRKSDAVIFMSQLIFDSCFILVKYVYFIAGVGIATRLSARRSEVRIPVPTRDVSQLENVETGSMVPPGLLFSGYRGSFPGAKWPGLEVNHSSPSSGEVEDGWSCTSAPHICVHCVERDKFTFLHLPVPEHHSHHRMYGVMRACYATNLPCLVCR